MTDIGPHGPQVRDEHDDEGRGFDDVPVLEPPTTRTRPDVWTVVMGVVGGALLGTGITLVAQHDPIDLAKQIATVDHLSGGRLTLGLGNGWNVEEAADHGVEWSTRRELVRDRMALMRALWSEEPTAYDGEFGSVRASTAYPKPVRKARGPVVGPRTLIGGAAGPKLFAQNCASCHNYVDPSKPADEQAFAVVNELPTAERLAVFPQTLKSAAIGY